MLRIVILWMVVYLTGMLLCKIGREKETSRLWIHLTGFFFLFFSQGVVFTIAQLLHMSFGQAYWILTGVLIGVSLFAAIICHRDILALKDRVKKAGVQTGRGRYLALIFWLWLGIFLVLSQGMVGNRQDAVMEIMETTLLTDTMNEFHPFTGQPMELGVIMSKKIYTLPFWYAALKQWVGFSAQNTVWMLGSFITITFFLMASLELAAALFRRNFGKLWLFVVMLELLILSGDYASGAAGYQLLFYGYAGETIVASVALPMVLTLLYRLFLPLMQGREEGQPNEERMSLWSVIFKLVLILGGTIFIAPPAFGMVFLMVGIFLFILCLGTVFLIKRFRKKEVPVCK